MGLLLFDMDGTLVRGHYIYGPTMGKAILGEYGKYAEPDMSRFHGYTDKLVLKQVLLDNNIRFDNKSLDRCLTTFGELYPENPPNLELIPGVPETIPTLSMIHLIGLLTGNVEPMARKKLRKFHAEGKSFNDYFHFGGFGNDPHETRSDLIPIAIQRARLFGWRGTSRDTYVIDDTPIGVIAALEAGVNAVGVTTGKYNEQDLRGVGAGIIIPNLRELLGLGL